MNKSYFYLVMKTHELEVPYTGKLRRVRVLLPKNYETDKIGRASCRERVCQYV